MLSAVYRKMCETYTNERSFKEMSIVCRMCNTFLFSMDQSSSFVLMLNDMELHNMPGRNIDMLAHIEQEGTDKKYLLENGVLLNLQVAKFL